MKIGIVYGACAVFIVAVTLIAAWAGRAFAQSPAEPASYQHTIGDAVVISLPDVIRNMSVEIFSGAPAEEINNLARNGIPSSIHSFLIKTGGHVVLIDTGNGKMDDPKSWLLPKLVQAGVKQSEVTHVLLTHLHGDHVGGLAWDGKAAFPNAQVLVSAPERDFWLSADTPAKFPTRAAMIELVKAVFALYDGKVKTFAFGDAPVPDIQALDASGHTPGNTVFLLESAGKKLLLWGDTMHGAALQFPNPSICASFDMDVPRAIQVRKNLMEMAMQEKIPVAGAHLPAQAVGMVKAGPAQGSYIYNPGLE